MTSNPVLRVCLTRWGRWLILIGLCAVALPCPATMWFQHGIGGEAIVHDGRVYFAQADKTLTMLDLDSGKVLRRLTDRPGIHDAVASDVGLVVRQTHCVALLDWVTLDEVWSVDYGEDYPQVVETRPGTVLVHGGGSFASLDSATGEVRWSIPDVVGHFVIEADYALFDVVGPFVTGLTQKRTILLVHLPSGRILREHTFEIESYIDRGFILAGEQLFAVDQEFPEHVVDVYRVGMDGQLNRVDDDPDVELIGEEPPWFVRIGERYFDCDGTQVDADATRHWRDDEPFKRYEAGGFRLYEEPSFSEDGDLCLTVEEDGNVLRLLVPHTSKTVPTVTLTDDFILFATHQGTVECVERTTGASLWLYVSNWNSGLASYSGGSLIDWNGVVEDFDAQAGSAEKRMPSMIVPAGKDWVRAEAVASNAAVIEDPEPVDPYSDFRELRSALRSLSLVLAGLIGLGWYWLHKREKRDRWLALTCAVMFCLTAGLLRFFLAVSLLGTFIWLAQACVLILATVYFSFRLIRHGQGLVSAGVSLGMIAVCLWWAWPIGRYVPWLFATWVG
ncbi:MAG: PQQ-binding-like beta-propeller repeat protein [Planctomycetota bacterium]